MNRTAVRRCLLPVAMLVLVTGCAGPETRLDFGGKAVPINVAFGKPAADASAAPTPAVVLIPVPGGFGVVPGLPGPAGRPPGTAPRTAPLPSPATPAPLPCPTQDPLSFPRVEATSTVDGEVPEGSFPYRTSGTFTVNGATSAYTEQVVQRVTREPVDAAGRKRFRVEYSLLDVPYTVSYAVQAPADPVPGEIAMAATVRDSADGTGASFRPVEPLRLLQLRSEREATWTEATTDPLSGSSATVSGVVEDKVNVNACGTPVQTWKAVVTQRTVTPLQDITATRTLYFATGYGGLLVAEEVSFTGRTGADTVSGTSTTTIDVDPGA